MPMLGINLEKKSVKADDLDLCNLFEIQMSRFRMQT